MDFIQPHFLLLVVAMLVVTTQVHATTPTPSSANCTWKFFEQPLSHFERGNKGTYRQRLCIYDGYYKANQSLPIFLYTGNESPVDEYVNNTGLMWTLAEQMQALIIFAEHRYFGESIPTLQGKENCIAYLTSEEALADYAMLTNWIRRDRQTWGANQETAIIAFGGSYGGMLASWMRTLYPSAIDGAIAASAPVWGFPLNTCPLDGSAQVVSYATSAAAGSSAYCSSNLKASYVLFTDLGQTTWGRELLNQHLPLCTPLTSSSDVPSLLNYLQAPLFDLAEGSYPFPSNYITFALTGSSDALLPAWAMQVMCQSMDKDFGISISGSEETVQFTVSDTKGKLVINADWDQLSNNGYSAETVVSETKVMELLTATLQSIQVWYNVSGTLPACINWQGGVAHSDTKAPVDQDKQQMKKKIHNPFGNAKIPGKPAPFTASTSTFMSEGKLDIEEAADDENICTLDDSLFDSLTAWNILTCNEGINLVNWRAQGVGHDKLYWPPNVPRDYSRENIIPGSLRYCGYYKSIGLYGIPNKRDDWSLWLDTVYGGTRNMYTSNIVYSNGDLDPWMPAGVDMHLNGKVSSGSNKNILSLLIQQGGHHLDLFWPTESDPASVK
jgi:lysosomal Pro-X carboxypeptidase